MICEHDERDTANIATLPIPLAVSDEPWAQEWNRQALPPEGVLLRDLPTVSYPHVCKSCGDGLPDDIRRRYFPMRDFLPENAVASAADIPVPYPRSDPDV